MRKHARSLPSTPTRCAAPARHIRKCSRKLRASSPGKGNLSSAKEGAHMRLSREKTVRLSHRVIDFLVSVPSVDFVEDRDTIRTEIVNIITALLKVEEQVDTEVRAKITSQKKEILEGSEEWDIMYRKYYAEGLKRLGVAEVHTH